MTTHPDTWAYGDYAPDPLAHDLVGLKARWILDHLPVDDHPSVLDFGVGQGKHLRLVQKARPAAALVGVDVRDVQGQPFFEFHKIAADSTLPFADDSFDVVVSCDVLEHVDDIQRSLDEIRRVMRPGGRFMGFVPVEGGLRPHALFRLFNRDIYRDTKDHKHAYRRTEMLRWLSTRFRVADVAYSYHLLGATLDAVFFAGFKLPAIGPRVEAYWRGQENAFYRGNASTGPQSALGSVAQLANRMAYWESRALHRVPIGAIGLHFCLEKPQLTR